MNEQTVILKPIIELKRALNCLKPEDCRSCRCLRYCLRAKKELRDLKEKHMHLKIKVINNVKSLKGAMACFLTIDCNRCGCRDRCLKLAIKGGWRDS